MKSKRYSSALLIIVGFVAGLASIPAAGQIQVNSTNPAAAPQGTVNLNVTISGSGFKKGAKAAWYVTGTTNPGGVTVNSTTFNGSSSLTANISVASDAVTSGFDVVVMNADGRTGKGTDAFTVTSKGTPIGCWTTGTPTGFTLVTELNPVQPNGAAQITTLKLGNAIRVRPLDLNKDGVVDSLVAFVSSGSSKGSNPGAYVFFLDPATGQMQSTNPVTGAGWQNPLLVLSGVQAGHPGAGDVNGDGIPDFGIGSVNGGVAYLVVGAVSGSPSFTPSYTAYQLLPPSGSTTSGWGSSVAFGDLDGDSQDEIVVGAPGTNKQGAIPAVYIFKYTGSGVSYIQTIQDPTGSATSSFGGEGTDGAVVIGKIAGSAGNDLVVGAKAGGTNGLVYVFPYPASQSNYFTLSGPGPQFGEGLGIADVNGDGILDLVVITGKQFSGSDTSAQALVFPGNLHASETYVDQLLPGKGMAYSWAALGFDVGEMLAAGELMVGTPNFAQGNGNCTNVGAAQLYVGPFGASQGPSYIFEPPDVQSEEFGYGLGVVPGYPFVVVGAHFANVGTTTNAGQVYVYKKN